MGSFAAMFGAQANTPIGRLGGAQVGNGAAPNALNIPSTNRVAPSKAGGLVGMLENIPIGVANSFGNITAEGAAGVGQALTGDKDILLHKNPATDGMSAAYAQSSPVAQAMSNEAAAGGSVGQQLEVGAGGLASDVTNVGGLLLGPGEMAGKTGLGLIGSGAKIGGELGLVGGASGAAAQGGSAGQVAESAGLGAAEGAGIGAAGGTLGATLGKLSGRTADQAGAGADAAVGNQGNGVMTKTATKGAARVANKEMAQSSIDFSGDANGEAKKILSYDKNGGNPVGIQSVQGFLRALGLPDTAAGMQALSNISNRTIAPDLRDMAAGTNIDASQANAVGTDSVSHNVGKPTNDLSGSGSATIAQRTINDATNKLGPQSTMDDVLEARQKLASAKAVSQANTKSGDLVGAGVSRAYQDTIDRLDAQAGKSGVNDAVANHHVSPEGEAKIRQVVREEAGKLFDRPNASPKEQDAATLAREKAIDKTSQHFIDAENNAKSYENLTSEQQIPTIAGQLAKVARDTFESAPTKLDKTTGRPQVPSWYLASALTGNPVGMGAVLAHLAESTHPIEGIAGKLNPDAFAAAKEAAMAPNEATQAKLDNPGTIGGAPTELTQVPQTDAEKMGLPSSTLTRQTPASSMEGRRGEAMHPAPAMSNEAATQPAQTAPPTPQASSVQQPTGVPVQAPQETPMASVYDPETGTSAVMNQDEMMSRLAELRAIPANDRGSAQNEEIRNLSDGLKATVSQGQPTPQASSVQEPTGVPVQGDMTQNPTAPAVEPTPAQPIGIRANANPSPGPEVNGISGPIPNSGATMGARPGALENTLNAVTGGAHAIASRVQPAEEAIENAAGKVPGAVANRIQNSSIGRAVSAGSKPGANKLIGALTGMGAATTGQSAQAQLARKGGGSVTAATSPEIPTSFTLASGSSGSGTANPNSVYPQSNELADIMADPTHASTYETLYKDLNPTPTAAQSTGAQSIIDASGYINTIEQELNSFGGVSLAGGLAASIPILGKYIEPQITAYNATKNDAAIALAKALTGKSASAAQVKITAESLPDITDSPEEAATKLDNIRLELAKKAPGYGLVPAQ